MADRVCEHGSWKIVVENENDLELRLKIPYELAPSDLE